MRALLLDEPGGAFRIVDMPRPKPGVGEILVRVLASGVNPLDTKIRAGKAAHARHRLPGILGIDLAGIVDEVGEGVEGFAQSDEVWGMTGGVAGVPGSLAQFAAVDARLVAKKPANLSMREAAALPLSVVTAWEGLVDRASVLPGETVLVMGGAGGVGHVVVQIALANDAKVFATASKADHDYIRALGAQPVDRDLSVSDYVKQYTAGVGFDLVYDTVGGVVLDQAFQAVRRFGHVVSCLGWGTHALAPLSFRGGTYSGVFTLLPLITGEGREHHGAIMAEATTLAEAGKLVPRLDARRFTLETVSEAHALVEQGAAHGKLVIDVS